MITVCFSLCLFLSLTEWRKLFLTINTMQKIISGISYLCSECAGCGEDIRSGQSLLALEKQWHLWCFTCTKCGCLLAGEYMGRLVK